MIFEIMKYCKNFFVRLCIDGTFVIEGGCINLPEVKGRFIMIEGSAYNDGVYPLDTSDLDDETFTGVVYVLNPPRAFLNLVEEIEEWINTNKSTAYGPFSSESFGGYSYTKATTSTGAPAGWQGAFQTRLNAWRKL